MLQRPIDAVLLLGGIVVFLVSALAAMRLDLARRAPFLIAAACGLGTFVVVFGALQTWGPNEKGRDLFHAGLLIAAPLAVALGIVATRYTTPTLQSGWAALAALGGLAALPLSVSFLVAVDGGGFS